MENADQRPRGTEPPGDRLSRLSRASLRINESLDMDTSLQAVMDGARSLTDAPYAAIITVDASGVIEDHLSLGFDPADAERMWQAPQARRFFEYVDALPGPLRVGRLEEFARSIGLRELRLPVELTTFMAAPLQYQGVRSGHIYVGSGDPSREFSREDEETLVLFASQAALVISNARRYRDEQRARASLETLIDTSPVGVAVFDMKTGAEAPSNQAASANRVASLDLAASLNREARRIAGILRDPDRTQKEARGSLTVRRADGSEVSLQEYPLARLLGSSKTVRAEEIVLGAPGGRSVTVLLNSTPIRSPEGDAESVVVTMQDMAAVKEQERLRAEFLGMVSHELRMPLTSIWGSAMAMMEPEMDPAAMRQFQRIILDQVGSMRTMIDDLLDVARIETGALPVDPEPAEVAALVDRAWNAFTSAGGRNQLAIEMEPDLPLVMADRGRIVQVIGNLLSNAARRSPESSAIQVSAVRRRGHVEVSVADQGRGIPAEDLPPLFRKFSRREDRDAGGGTGLELTICKGIVEAHGGRIRAESDGSGLGARFVFTLPAVEGAEPAPRPAARAQDGGRSAGTVLVVDYDPVVLRSARETLSGAGFRAVVAADPKEALALVAEHSPRLALLDLMLPEQDGVDLMADILAAARIPVIFLSAYGREDLVAGVLEQGAADYIVKPFSPTELVARVRAALRRSGEPQRLAPEEPFVLGDLRIDHATRRVTVSGRPAPLTPTEFDLLATLAMEAGRVVPHDRLLRRAWSPGKPGNLSVLRTHLKHLRRKLGDDAGNPTYIFAEPRVGYRMPAGETEPAAASGER